MDPIYALDGQVETYRPATYVTWKAEELASTVTVSADRTIALIGEAEGGIPLAPYVFTTPTQAVSVLRAGELLDAVLLAFSAAGTTSVPVIVAVNVKGGTPATFTLAGQGGGTFGTLTTSAYRERANQTQVQLSGDTTNGFSVVLSDKDSGYQLSGSRIGLGLLLQYQGQGQGTATAQIVSQGGVLYLQTSIQGRASENLSIPLTSGSTISQLCQQISQAGPYSALAGRDGGLLANTLDATAPVSIEQYGAVGKSTAGAASGATSVTLDAPVTLKSGTSLRYLDADGSTLRYTTVTADVTANATVPVSALPAALPAGARVRTGAPVSATPFTAIQGDFTRFFATRGGGEVSLSLGAAALPATQSGVFTGGSTQNTQLSSWGAAVDNLASFPLAIITPLTSNQGVIAGIRAQVLVRASAGVSKFTTLVAGFDDGLLPVDTQPGSTDSYVSTAAAAISTINDRNVQMIATTGTLTLPTTGVRVRAPMYMVGALFAGEAAGLGPGESMTYRYLALSDSFPALNAAQSNALVRAGAVALETPTAGGVARVVSDCTTYTATNNPTYASGKAVRLMNSVARGMKALQDLYIPGAGSASRLAIFQQAATDYFDSLVSKGWLVSGVDENGTPVAPYSFTLARTQNGGRRVISSSKVVPAPEFTVGEHAITARNVEFQVS